MSQESEKKTLHPEQAVQAACFLFELNTREGDILEMADRAGIPHADAPARKTLTREWYGFVHAAVVYGLMAQAPNLVMAEYLRSTRALLEHNPLLLPFSNFIPVFCEIELYTRDIVIFNQPAPETSSIIRCV